MDRGKYLRQAVNRWRIGDCFILTIKKLEMPVDKENRKGKYGL